MKHTNRKGFIEYVHEHVPFMGFITTTKGTIYLDVCGYDGGDVSEKGLNGIPFTDTQGIDQFISDAAKRFEEPKPEVTYTEYCK
jgi:hypothetical protein